MFTEMRIGRDGEVGRCGGLRLLSGAPPLGKRCLHSVLERRSGCAAEGARDIRRGPPTGLRRSSTLTSLDLLLRVSKERWAALTATPVGSATGPTL